MTVEVLFRELCNLNADGQNSVYLRECMPDAEFIETPIGGEPYFKDGRPDIIMMGHMSESTQRAVVKKLMPFKSRIEELIDAGTVFLMTGNACEVFCRHISYVTEKTETDALGIFPLDARCDLFDRYNGKQLSVFNGEIKLVGFKSQFSFLFGDNSQFAFAKCERGIGINRESVYEGMRKNNFLGTHLSGPILPLNPLFTEYVMRLAGHGGEAAFREAAMDAYRQHLKEFEDPEVRF